MRFHQTLKSRQPIGLVRASKDLHYLKCVKCFLIHILKASTNLRELNVFLQHPFVKINGKISPQRFTKVESLHIYKRLPDSDRLLCGSYPNRILTQSDTSVSIRYLNRRDNFYQYIQQFPANKPPINEIIKFFTINTTRYKIIIIKCQIIF